MDFFKTTVQYGKGHFLFLFLFCRERKR